MVDWPREAIIRDFLEKLILLIIEPALVKAVELALRPAANNCQRESPRIA